mmetsp:Transcript_150735/g.482336  ORF Transcript_150735/g.482336 Transcript_150735/m.482336 type:complete len:193 (+) Transcript_150735:877-1455(+)
MLAGNAANASERRPLFPGERCFPLSPEASPTADTQVDELACSDQLALILKVVGSPDDEEVDETIRGPSDSAVVKAAKDYVNSFPNGAPRDLRELYPASSDDSLDLLGRLLRFSPQRRLPVPQALAHPFLAGFPSAHGIEASGSLLPRVPPLDFESDDLTVPRLRQLLLREIRHFHPEMTSDAGIATSHEDHG